MDLTDAQLIEAFQRSGDRPALDALIRRHLARVRAIIYPMVLDDALADDLTQDALVRALGGLQNFRGQSEFSTWLCVIAMNCVRSHLQRRTSRTLPLDPDIIEGPQQHSDSPALIAMHHELDAAIRASLERLTPKLRAAVALISLGDFSAEEAAVIEGCSVSTMYWRLHEARRQLKQLLKAHVTL